MNHALISREKAISPASRRTSAKPDGRGLRIAEPHDSVEREADRIAGDVLAGKGTKLGWSLSQMDIGLPLRRKCSCDGSSGSQCEECKKKDEKKEMLHRRAVDSVTPSDVPPIVYEVLNSPGTSLDQATLRFFEPRFGYDFSRVRIHTDQRAAESARAVNAHAWTVGQDIIFAHGKYAPQTADGKNLLAHELAHTIQQRGVPRLGGSVPAVRDSEYNRLERDARIAATSVSSGRPASLPPPATRPRLSRADDEDIDPTTKPGTEVKPAPKTQPQQVHGSVGLHTVTPTEVFSAKVKDSSGNEAVETIEEFEVKPFYLPAEKGANAYPVYDSMKGQALQTILEIQGTGKAKTALWQKRESPTDLRDLWVEKVGWGKGSRDDLWQRSGGDKAFPQVGNKTCQMDHIVELQIGGNNTPQNIQPLDATPNQSSGAQIRGQMETLAIAINADQRLATGSAKQIKMRFTEVKQVGKPPALADCPLKAKTRTCLEVEKCAKGLKVETTASGDVTVAHQDYAITAGGHPPTNLKVPVTFPTTPAEEVTIEGDKLNDSASTLIPGLLLTKLGHQKANPKADFIQARIDDREKTRLPISVDKGAKPLQLNVNLTKDADGKTVGDLKLDPKQKTAGLGFTYKYLSPGKITELGVDADGNATWKGTITPGIPFLGQLGVQYAKNSLVVTKGLDEETLKKRSVLGMRLTKAQIELQLAPDFKPQGVIEMQMGSGANPLAQASLNLSADSIGLLADGKLKVNIPKMQTSEVNISYKGGASRNEWLTEIHIKSDEIKLGPATIDGQFDGKIEKGDITFTGKINASFPGDNKAELGLRKEKDDWVLFGGGTFKFPKLDPTTVEIYYSLGKEILVAKGKTGFTIPAIGLKGRLDEVKFVLGKDLSFDKAKFSGKGGLDFEKGKAKGHVDVALNENGKFSGKGSLTYALKENLIVTGTVELNEQEKLRVTGELLVTRYELFKQYGDKKDLFTIDLPIPVPALSIGTTAGLVFHIRGGIGVAYSFGPGAIEPLKFTAGFDPLEEDKNVEFTVTGSVKIPASASLSAFISGSLAVQVDVLVGSAGAEGGLQLQGDLTLSAGAFANLDASYKAHKFAAKVVAGIDTKLLLGLTLTAFARAWAGAFGIQGEIRKDWTLAKKTIDTGVGFYLSAPFEYADDTGIKLPELKDITLRKPEFNFSNILNQVFGSAQTKEKEK